MALPNDLGTRENTISLESVRLTWEFGIHLGEPVYGVTGQYRMPAASAPGYATITNASVCAGNGGIMPGSKPARLSPADLSPAAWAQAMRGVELLSSSVFRVVLVNNTGGPNTRVYLDVSPDSLVQETGSETALSVPASPSWDRLFRVSSGSPSASDPWLSAAQAKAIFQQGVHVREVRLIRPEFDLSALRGAYDAHLRETCTGPVAAAPTDRKEKGGKEAAAPRKAASAPAQQQNAGPKSAAAPPPLDMSLFGQGKAVASGDTAGNTAVASASSSAPSASSSGRGKATASMLLLIDASGSMQGNRLVEAKRAARDAIKRAASVSGTEFSVASFSGECANPRISVLPFTRDVRAADRFIQSIAASGGTPLGPAVSHVNRFMDASRSKDSKTQIIILLADGADSCNDVGEQVARLKREGILFRHETIGLETDATTSEQLRQVAAASGGSYHHADSAEKLAQSFKAATENSRLLDMLGGFGKTDTKRSGTSGQGSVNWDILSGTSQ
ncbi:Mg-chelatase subunit ChlD [Pseudoxanthobacter soli DSM 19599]|uniref:Mg-chelatase subunit ChlD n=1 Tax=Pseudoxanthobacter soli DSM 19599 TaxID=1123029 RepID=A0A1M7Z4C9_9HYPH|nr:vWA domain-containing protein [Pseudoxanthobacter soli]SHO59709.1 Mg-chelatase subunit ChlD [Pseudoxanthobacter soli DSM 19599]